MHNLANYDQARHYLQLAKKEDEVKDIRDKAIALEAYARQAKNTEMETNAVKIRLRAERKVGQLLRERERGGGGDRRSDGFQKGQREPFETPESDNGITSCGYCKKLYDSAKWDADLNGGRCPYCFSASDYAAAKTKAGISDTQAKRWQKLADVPEEKFEEELNGEYPTTAGIIDRHHATTQTAPKVSTETLDLWGRMKHFEEYGLLTLNLEVAIEEMTPTMEADCLRLAPEIVDLLARLERLLYEYRERKKSDP